MPVHDTLCGRHIWQKKNSNPTLTIKCHKVTGKKSPFFVNPPPPGFRGLEGSYPHPPARSNFPPT